MKALRSIDTIVIASVLTGMWLLQIFSDSVFGFYEGCPWWCRVSYSLFHGNLLHLAGNALSIALFSFVLREKFRIGRMFLYVSTLICAILATFGSEFSIPTVGASGILFAMIGIYTVFHHNRDWMITLAVVSVVNALLFWNGNMNAPLHLLAFSYGLVSGFVWKVYDGVSVRSMWREPDFYTNYSKWIRKENGVI